MLVYPLENIIDFDILVNEVTTLIDEVGINNNQIICQQTTPDDSDWTTGIGRIAELDHQNENLYKFVNKKLKGSKLEELIIKYNAFRTRIMIMTPRQCYSVHADPTPRLHIPIITNDQSWMIWPYINQCSQMRAGKLYWADTTKHHSFLNGGETARVHVVMGVEK
jgi:hypothetical protein